MNRIAKIILDELTVTDLLEYFNQMGIHVEFQTKDNIPPEYYAKNSRLYKRSNK